MNLPWLSLLGLLLYLWIGISHGSPTPPSKDPFYRLPTDHQTKHPGDILNYRPLPYPLKTPLPLFFEKGYQIVYRTTDSFDQPTASLATLLIPPNANFSRILVYFPVHNSAYIDCSPSYILAEGSEQEGDSSDQGIELIHILPLSGALLQGWVVMMPDFEGLNAAFLVNRRGAFAGLDSIRAAIASSSFSNISPDATAVMMGYSGASSAAVLAAEFQGDYAPELKIQGLAAGGLLVNLPNVLEKIISTPNNVPPAMWGLANEYSAMDRLLQERLVTDDPVKKEEFEKSRYQCAGALKATFRNANISAYFDGLDFVNSSTVKGILNENRIGQDNPRIPVLVYQSTHDDKSTVPEMDAFVQNYCEAGVLVDYRKYKLESHNILSIDGVFGALLWAKDRFDGISMGNECKTSNHTTAIWPALREFVPKALVDFIDRHPGTNMSRIL
ncbi:hypothetical protein FE257_008329 [Aspergillus nanangensis]|uniref:Secretory lipase-domain-containing protein n=1 Tax=Aspergillus nanangensis TaxID=2582783 RepID=A0AAD4CLJ3_ASPNN|nr:hypothetical protein FE257_008329 [Aspergillus nanangensis]